MVQLLGSEGGVNGIVDEVRVEVGGGVERGLFEGRCSGLPVIEFLEEVEMRSVTLEVSWVVFGEV